jgi:hypothetical protein
MTPEQLRGEVHRLDGRTDVWALGVILYELLARRRPFGGNWDQLVDEIQHREPKPPRQIDDTIPEELERICLKCLAKDVRGRYQTAADLAADLRRWKSQAGGRRLPVRRRLVIAALFIGGLATLAAIALFREPLRSEHPVNVANSGELIVSMEVRHYRGRPADSLGTLGVNRFAARFGDDVRVLAKLGAPAYCYLLAFNPNGTEQLCDPADNATAPSQSVVMDYPPGELDSFGLTDGPGLQAFVLLASRQPLPAYAEWRGRIQEIPWRPVEASGVWRFDGARFEPLGSERGQVRQLADVPQPFVELCQFLQEWPGVDAIQALAFPVRPEEEKARPRVGGSN